MAYTYQLLFQPLLYRVATGNQELILSNDGMKHPAVEQLPRRQAMKDWLQSSVKRKAGEQSLKTNALRSTRCPPCDWTLSESWVRTQGGPL